MISDNIKNEIIERNSLDSSGIASLNGFSFQFSNAIFEITKKYREDEVFSMVFESHDDFLLFDTNTLYLFQAKNLKDKTHNANNLTKELDKSIIGKMKKVRENISDILTSNIESHLLISNDKAKIGLIIKSENKKAYRTKSHQDKICLSIVSDECKKQLLKILTSKELDSFFIVRQLRYKKHEDDARLFIEDVLNEKFINPLINLQTVYDFLERRIKNSMISKKFYCYDDMKKDMVEIVHLQNGKFEPFSEIEYLLTGVEAHKVHIIRNRYKTYISSLSSSKINDIYGDYQKVKCNINLDDLLEESMKKVGNIDFENIYDEEQLIAMILLTHGEK